MKKKKVLLFIVSEGPTDEEFYKKALSEIRRINNSQFKIDKLKHICAGGVSNIYSKAVAKIRFEIQDKNEFQDYEKVVCLCYDHDVFEAFPHNPPLDLDKVRSSLVDCGVKRIIEIVANSMIEDWFVEDIEGTKEYLKLPKKYKTPKELKGLQLLQRMFKDASRIYAKGTLVSGYVDKLYVAKILSNHCSAFKPLCDELGVGCCGGSCSQASNVSKK